MVGHRLPLSLKRKLTLVIAACTLLLVAAIGYLIFVLPIQRAEKSHLQLKWIVLHLLKYEDVFRYLPNGHFQKKKFPHRFSWRVHILLWGGPEEKELYEKFNFLEPWDSPHNLKVAQQMPHFYRSPYASKNTIFTSYVAIADPQGAFPVPRDREDRINFDGFTDGTSTVGIVRVEETDIVWTEPRDIDIDEFVQLVEKGKLTPPKKGKLRGNLQVGLLDGSVRNLPRSISAQTARAICTRNGGEKVTESDLR